MDLEEIAHLWAKDGFVVLPGAITEDQLDSARNGLQHLFPTADDYHAAPGDDSNIAYAGDEYAGLRVFPFSSVDLSLLVSHPTIVDIARACLGDHDVRIYAAEAWAKYTGAAAYEQDHHRDYLNHTPLGLSSDPQWRGLEMFVLLSDVSPAHGPTALVSLQNTAHLPAMPHGYRAQDRPELYEAEVLGVGPAGTIVVYSTDTFHRATEMTAASAARFTIHCSWRHPDATWIDRYGWGDRSFDPAWAPWVQRATVEQLRAFGFPPPGHPYWTTQTLASLAERYPDLDIAPFRPRPIAEHGPAHQDQGL